MEGILIKYENNNINTDVIIPARYLTKSDPKYLALHCFEDLDPKFQKKRQELNATILVSGKNFGSGSSREHAPIAIKASGIKCVIAPSFARIFFRNSINIGLTLIEFQKIDKLENGDHIEIDFDSGILKNSSKNLEFEINKLPNFLQEIITSGGLVNYAKKLLKI